MSFVLDNSSLSSSSNRIASAVHRADLRSSELVDRVRWYISMRWLAVLACGVGTAATFLDLAPVRLESIFFVVATSFLAATNLLYTFGARRLMKKPPQGQGVQVFLVLQMLGDFMALSLLAYALGSIETPILTLFMAHIILATLFFSRMGSLAIIAAAWLFASVPLILEWACVIPTVSILDGPFKQTVAGSFFLTSAFIAGIGGAYFVCWYLVSVISTSLKVREKQLEAAYEMVIRMDREKTQATLRATHELKAPFAAIKSHVYTLRDGYCGELPEKARKVVSRIGARCDQLIEKITDIIHLSNLKSLVITGRNWVPVDLVPLLAEACSDAGLVGESRGIKVRYHTGGLEPVTVMGSKPDLQTLFSNLLQNAVTYSRDRGEVDVFMKHESRQVSVRIVDHGIGIPEQNLPKIFDEHFRSNNAVAHHPSGTGLGLPIVKEIARLHRATIRVESEVGRGSQFTVGFETTVPKHEGGNHGQNPYHR